MTPEAKVFTSGYRGDQKFDSHKPPKIRPITDIVIGSDAKSVHAMVPLSLIEKDEVPFDEGRANHLAESFLEERNLGREGMNEEIFLCHLVENGNLEIANGFHRRRASEIVGDNAVRAKIRLNSTWEELTDFRIEASLPHESVKFARIFGWITEEHAQTPWGNKITVYEAFVLSKNPGNKRIKAKLDEAEVQEVIAWPKEKCQIWKTPFSSLYEKMSVGHMSDPELVNMVRDSKNSVFTIRHLKNLARQIPGEYELQQVGARFIMDNNLGYTEASAVGIALAGSNSVVEGRQVLESGRWRVRQLPEVSRPTTAESNGKGGGSDRKPITKQRPGCEGGGNGHREWSSDEAEVRERELGVLLENQILIARQDIYIAVSRGILSKHYIKKANSSPLKGELWTEEQEQHYLDRLLNDRKRLIGEIIDQNENLALSEAEDISENRAIRKSRHIRARLVKDLPSMGMNQRRALTLAVFFDITPLQISKMMKVGHSLESLMVFLQETRANYLKIRSSSKSGSDNDVALRRAIVDFVS